MATASDNSPVRSCPGTPNLARAECPPVAKSRRFEIGREECPRGKPGFGAENKVVYLMPRCLLRDVQSAPA